YIFYSTIITISAREGRQQLGEKLLLLELIPKASNATVLKIGKIKAARIVDCQSSNRDPFYWLLPSTSGDRRKLS
ncbi:hypothetical protein LINPERHAP1_LOCUS13941, partial [Linum perenne]